eukprot:XP_001695328.1 predicted protein [Chlamydomonas reinhardtii]
MPPCPSGARWGSPVLLLSLPCHRSSPLFLSIFVVVTLLGAPGHEPEAWIQECACAIAAPVGAGDEERCCFDMGTHTIVVVPTMGRGVVFVDTREAAGSAAGSRAGSDARPMQSPGRIRFLSFCPRNGEKNKAQRKQEGVADTAAVLHGGRRQWSLGGRGLGDGCHVSVFVTCRGRLGVL